MAANALIHLESAVVARQAAMRAAGEDYGEVIQRLARVEAGS